MSSCNIRGVPLTTQIINLIGSLTIILLCIEPKLIISPSGNENTNVNKNNLRVPKKPSKSDNVTFTNIMCPLLFYSVTIASCTPYLFAISSIVPSSYKALSSSLIYAARSEPFLQPIPYSSVVSSTVCVRLS